MQILSKEKMKLIILFSLNKIILKNVLVFLNCLLIILDQGVKKKKKIY